MMVCTYIMNHPLTIAIKSRDAVLAQLSTPQNPSDYPEETSPWMASMQLRHYFSNIRSVLYTRNLYNLQQILHRSSGRRQRVSAFVIVLGLGVVLEECQHTLLLQANGRVARGEANEVEARLNLRYELGEIDHEYEFLCNLLHCKYQNGRKTQKASLRAWIDTTGDRAEKKFLNALRDVCDENCESPFTSPFLFPLSFLGSLL